MTDSEKAQAEQLKKHGDVKEALEQATPPPEAHRIEPRRARIVRLVVYAALIALFLAFRIAVSRGAFHLSSDTTDLLRRASLGAVFIVLGLLAGKAVEIFFLPRLDTVSRYNIKRVLRLVIALASIVIVISAIFVDWYAALVSLGLASLILGFALQTPITSFIGWVYILARKPYRVGDRIVIGNAAGNDRRFLSRHDALGVRRFVSLE